jgi:hypothetical protein
MPRVTARDDNCGSERCGERRPAPRSIALVRCGCARLLRRRRALTKQIGVHRLGDVFEVLWT